MSTSYQIKILERINEVDGIEYNAIYVDGLPYDLTLIEINQLLHRKLIAIKNESLFITDLGKKHLAEYHLALERLPQNIPQTNAKTKHTTKYHIGTSIVNILRSDWFKLIVTGLIALILGT